MGVTYLLDTHVLLWLLGEPDRVAGQVIDEVSDPSNQLVVSSATGLEVATKVRIGKLDAPQLPAVLAGHISRIGAQPLPISLDHALLAGSLAWAHRDPFDRLLLAQAIIESATLVTVDRVLVSRTEVPILTW